MGASTDLRLQQLEQWLGELPGIGAFTMAPASADASFRRYFRITLNAGNSLIAMDAPPDKEDCHPFVDITRRLEKAGLQAPHIHAADTDQGFLLLDDLGSRDYLQSLTPATADSLYQAAITALHKIQQADYQGLPAYDASLLQNELDLFTDWFLGTHLQIDLDSRQRETLQAIYRTLIDNALQQPSVFVHRDYHSRNLMTTAEPPGIIDYQDAVHGPLTYDLVSLLRDCYIDWPEPQVRAWALGFHQTLRDRGALEDIDEAHFMRWFDLMGIQRHLKAIGIFSRLNHRDGKPGYLQDIPRTLGYVIHISRQYTDTAALSELIDTLDIPRQINPS
jgi:aminoglycoside/choline kinase family phosphotransferase